MEITKKELEPQLIEVEIKIAAADYAQVQRKRGIEIRKNADFKGFRKGNVPMSLIQKMYGEQILAESVNNVVGEAVEKYITDNKLRVLGEPLPSENQPENVWESGKDFSFKFEIALSPEVKLEPGKDDVVPEYTVTVSAKEKKDTEARMKEYYQKAAENVKEGQEAPAAKTDEEIAKEVEENLKKNYSEASLWRVNADIRNFFVEKAGLKLPSAFLKRWLFEANKGKFTMEDIEKDYESFEKDLKWQLVRGTFMEKFGFKVENADIETAAKDFIKAQYAMYGLQNMPEDMIMEAAKNVLNDRSQISRLVEQVEDSKVFGKLKELITLKSTKITSDKFKELK